VTAEFTAALSEGDYESLRALLHACVATESENGDEWDSMCRDPAGCPLAPAVRAASQEERNRIIDSFTDEQVVEYLEIHLGCYEKMVLNQQHQANSRL